MFKRACQNSCLHISSTAWNTGSNLIRCDPKLHVMMLVADRRQQTCEAHTYLWTCMCVCLDQGGISDHLDIRNNVLSARIMNLLYLSVINSGFPFITNWGMWRLNLILCANEVDAKVPQMQWCRMLIKSLWNKHHYLEEIMLHKSKSKLSVDGCKSLIYFS